jgi:O-Antigen ligase
VSSKAARVPASASAPRADVGSTLQARLAPWVYALSLAWWASSWNLRNSVLMTWSPVEPVWIGTAAVALCVVHRLGQPLRIDTAVAGPLLLLVLGFLPGALMTSGDGYGPAKLATMAFVLLPVLCAATLLLDSAPTRWRWAWAQAIMGGAVALGALEFNDPTRILQPGRFTLAAVDTISSSRLVGATVVVLLVVGLGSRRRWWWALPLAAGFGMVLVHIGSRGPLVAVVLTLAIVVLTGRCFAGRRALLMVFGAGVAVAAYVYARLAGGSGGARIVESLQSGLTDSLRAQLLSDAIHLGAVSPAGIGWGDFALRSDIGGQIANDAGVAYAHNVFAETFSEGGVLALLAFSAVAALALLRLWRLSASPREAVVLATLIYWLLNAQVSSDIVGNRFMWVAIACGVAAYADGIRPRHAGLESRRENSTRESGGDSRMSREVQGIE